MAKIMMQMNEVSVGVSGHSFVCPLQVSLYLYEYTTISKTLDIFLQPVH